MIWFLLITALVIVWLNGYYRGRDTMYAQTEDRLDEIAADRIAIAWDEGRDQGWQDEKLSWLPVPVLNPYRPPEGE